MTRQRAYYISLPEMGEESPSLFDRRFRLRPMGREEAPSVGARDLLGSRTLYYHRQERQFAFCTAVNPLFELSGVKKAINESWFAEFLAIPIILDSIDVNATVYRDIEQLPPAHWIAVPGREIGAGAVRYVGSAPGAASAENKRRIRGSVSRRFSGSRHIEASDIPAGGRKLKRRFGLRRSHRLCRQTFA